MKRTRINLALFFFLLMGISACEKKLSSPSEKEGKRPSFTFEGFQAFGSRGQEREWQAWAQRAEVYNDTHLAVATQLKVNYFKEGKVVSVLTADVGKINTATQDVTATGKVVLSGENGVVLTTTFLYWDHARERISTSAPVRVVRKDTVMTGIGLISDRNLGSVEVLRNVKIKARSVKSLRNMKEALGEKGS